MRTATGGDEVVYQEKLRKAAVARNATAAADGKTYQVEYFNLDAILSVGYRVNSKRATQFRLSLLEDGR